MQPFSGSEPRQLPRSHAPQLGPEPGYPTAMDAAYRFLSYRPRSEAEVRRRLSRRFPPDLVDRVIEGLRNQNYLNDEEFALRWRIHRERLHPRGRRVLQQELSRFGVDREVIDQALVGIEEEENAYRAALKLAAKLITKGCTKEALGSKLYPYLQRRGFGYSQARDTVDRLWRELAAHPLDGQVNPGTDPKETVDAEEGVEPSAGQL